MMMMMGALPNPPPPPAQATAAVEEYEMESPQGGPHPKQSSSAGPSSVQFAEQDPHLGPELVVPSDPEAVNQAPGLNHSDGGGGGPVANTPGCYCSRFARRIRRFCKEKPEVAALLAMFSFLVLFLAIGVPVIVVSRRQRTSSRYEDLTGVAEGPTTPVYKLF